MIRVLVKEGGIMPARGTKDSAAFDLYAPEDVYILPGTQVMIDLKIVIDLERLGVDYDFVLLPRSSSAKKGYRIANTVGLIDFDYRGIGDTLKVVIKNDAAEIYTTVMVDGHPEKKLVSRSDCLVFRKGEAVCQMVVRKHSMRTMVQVSEEDWGKYDNRDGFGSTTMKL